MAGIDALKKISIRHAEIEAIESFEKIGKLSAIKHFNICQLEPCCAVWQLLCKNKNLYFGAFEPKTGVVG